MCFMGALRVQDATIYGEVAGDDCALTYLPLVAQSVHVETPLKPMLVAAEQLHAQT